MIGQREGILVSDCYGVYKKWASNSRQTCLSHLTRKAKRLAESFNPELSKCGKWALKELRTLVHMARVPLSAGQWSAFYARCVVLLVFIVRAKAKRGSLSEGWRKKWNPPTIWLNERTIRFGALWRKRSQGTRNDMSEFYPRAILVSSNASPPSMSLWTRSLLISGDKNLILNG
ncbi:MAG: transposase [Deltaproteobacteria bacterium]|nr:transposase [Deltaproteobacteria bacterium]MBW2067316.1 transposase [Deltaproteobacteria bacterium]